MREKESILTPQIIFEDEYVLIVNKPAGWVVNDASTVKHNLVIQKWLEEKFKFPIFENIECRNGIVHRLDKETSGVLIVAKTVDSFVNIQKQFKDRIVKKTYVALLHDKLVPETGEVEASVGRLPWRRDRFGVLAGGRESKTGYKVLSYKEDNDKNTYSYTEFYPYTGRTHQIRIHAKYLHHPIVSDEFYAGRKRARKDRTWCPRLFLHAAKVSFLHPEDSQRVEYVADLHEDLKTALKYVK